MTKKKHIDPVNFRGLTYRIKGEDLSIDSLYFKSIFQSHQISFYANIENDYKLIIEDFGYFERAKWNQVEPEIYQIEFMEDLIAKELQKQYEIQEQREIDELIRIQDLEEIKKTNESINFNFHRNF